MEIIGLGFGVLLGAFVLLYCLSFCVVLAIEHVQSRRRRRQELAGLAVRIQDLLTDTGHPPVRRGGGRHRLGARPQDAERRAPVGPAERRPTNGSGRHYPVAVDWPTEPAFDTEALWADEPTEPPAEPTEPIWPTEETVTTVGPMWTDDPATVPFDVIEPVSTGRHAKKTDSDDIRELIMRIVASRRAAVAQAAVEGRAAASALPAAGPVPVPVRRQPFGGRAGRPTVGRGLTARSIGSPTRRRGRRVPSGQRRRTTQRTASGQARRAAEPAAGRTTLTCRTAAPAGQSGPRSTRLPASTRPHPHRSSRGKSRPARRS